MQCQMRTIATLLTTAALWCTLAACVGDDDADSPASTTSEQAVTTTSLSPREAAVWGSVLVVDERMVDEPHRYVGPAVESCDDILSGADPTTLPSRVQGRFIGGPTPDFTIEQAQQVIDLLRPLCS